ncbi:MAG: hypothetical protein ACO1Q7_19830 [Gemmatimonas sp.]
MVAEAPTALRERAAAETSGPYLRAVEASERALAAAGDELFERHFLFGGHRVRMRVAGREIGQHLERPFKHLLTSVLPDAPTGLTIDIWDERAVGVPYPFGGDWEPQETMWPIGQGTLAVSPSTRYVRYDCSSWVTWIDRAESRVVGWRANADRLSVHERTRPIPFLLPVWYGDRGMDIVHAGLVSRGDTGILFCGHNGAGKSTTSIACLCAGLDFLSDDHVGLGEDNGNFVGHSVFSSTRLEPAHLERSFPGLLKFAEPSPDWFEPKSLLIISEAMPERVRASVPVKAVVMPRIVEGQKSRIVPAKRAEALRALAPSTLMQMPFGSTPERFNKLARLSMAVPTFQLEIGRDVADIAARVNELIDQVS